MITSTQSILGDLGVEPKEILGFQTDEEMELALLPLMQINLEKETSNH